MRDDDIYSALADCLEKNYTRQAAMQSAIMEEKLD